MNTGAVVVLLVLLGLVALSVTTLVIAVRGGRGPADPPASRLRTEPSGFPVLPAPRGIVHGRLRPARPLPAAPDRPLVRGARRPSPAR